MSGVKLFFLLLLGVLVCIACVVVGQYPNITEILLFEPRFELSIAKCQLEEYHVQNKTIPLH
jgi:hypothetical protein